MSSRTLAFSCLLLLVACGKQAEANKADPKAAKANEPPGSLPPKRLPPNDPHAAPEPGEEPEAPLVASASGTFDFTVGDRLMHLRRIPPGQNRAVVIPDGNVARVTVAGALDESGWPNVRLTLEGFRPDQASYPTTLSTKKVGRGVSLRYQISEKSFYHVDQAEGADVEVTLEAYEGKTLRGSFAGTLVPSTPAMGGPIPVKGKFSVELGLSNVEPGPVGAAGAAPPAEGAPAEGAPAEGAPAEGAPAEGASAEGKAPAKAEPPAEGAPAEGKAPE